MIGFYNSGILFRWLCIWRSRYVSIKIKQLLSSAFPIHTDFLSPIQVFGKCPYGLSDSKEQVTFRFSDTGFREPIAGRSSSGGSACLLSATYLGRDTDYTELSFSRFSWVPPGKFVARTLKIRPLKLLSTCLPIHLSQLSDLFEDKDMRFQLQTESFKKLRTKKTTWHGTKQIYLKRNRLSTLIQRQITLVRYVMHSLYTGRNCRLTTRGVIGMKLTKQIYNTPSRNRNLTKAQKQLSRWTVSCSYSNKYHKWYHTLLSHIVKCF
jgi:hypothetical protein